ncbi:MAG: ATP-binding cassette domain-containing protein [Thaumarchaeota archaeon]|nr:ATP-binding cassette domain-containing protein [Nitrososphaerota archaeon]
MQLTENVEDPAKAIELQDIWFSYDGKNYILKEVNLSIKQGSSTVIVGANGCGKTTLLKIINGLVKPQKGSVRVFGINVNGRHGTNARRHIGYVPQQLGLLRNSTVLENVLVGGLARMGAASVLRLYPQEEIDYAIKCIDKAKIGHKVHEKVYRLSGGERQRVAIARALMQKPLIILADEFTSDLDYRSANEMMGFMNEFRRDGMALVMVTHNPDLAFRHGETMVFLKDGSKLSEAPAGKFDKTAI